MRPSLELPHGVTVREVADAARAALDAFLALDPHDARGLSRWLTGPYRKAVSFGPKRIRHTHEHHHVGVIEPALATIVTSAQGVVLSALEAAAEPGAEGLIAMIPNVVDVIPVHDVFHAHGFAPLDGAHLRLATRVITLLLADYLTRPDDYVLGPTLYAAPKGRVSGVHTAAVKTAV